MKRLPTFALLVAGLTLPIYAQRSASHGGFSGHSAPSFRGGFSASIPQRIMGAPRYLGSRPSIVPGLGRNGRVNYPARPAYSAVSPYRRPYLPPYRARVRFVAPFWAGSIGPGFLGYPDTIGYGDFGAPPSYAEPYESQPPEVSQPAPSNLYPESVEPSRSPSNLASEDAVTLVFKDGRPPEQIHNYILTRNTLYVRDQHRRDIPLEQLDLAATQRVNHDAGVDFQLPEAPK
jgi:hypothetical protein